MGAGVKSAMQPPPDNSTGLRLAILAPGELFGGAERQILTLAEALATGGQAAPVLVLFHDRELADHARRLGIPVRILGARGVVDGRAIRLLRQLLRKERFDAVSLHGYRASVYLALAAAGQPIGVVKTEHGNVEAMGHGLSQRLRPRLYRRLENAATRRLRAQVVYVTHDLEARCSGEHESLQRSVIYNGIAPLVLDHAAVPPEFHPEAMNLVAIGRLAPVKGLDIAIRAMRDPAMPSEARLFLVGSGPELTTLSDLARDLGVTARVSFLGFRENVYDYIAHADALLMPSHHEGLPYTLLEALSLATPVIASRVGGLAEVLTDRQTALLVDPDNPAALAQAVGVVAETPLLAEQLVRNGRDLIATGFTAVEMARQYLSLFESVRVAPRGG